jgi:hypothetical protein
VRKTLKDYRKVIGDKTPVTFFLLLLAITFVSKSLVVFAATDGTLNATSTGDLSMDLSIPNLTKLTDVADLNFGTYSGSGNAVLDDDVCVYTNNTSGQYKVTARGSGTSFAYTITNGSQTIPYTVRWNTIAGTAGNVNLPSNSQTTTLSGANTTSQSCGGVKNANFEVTMTRSAVLGVPAGTYSGILTLIIDAV